MVKFERVKEDEVVATQRKMQGKVSYPLLKAFIEANMHMAKVSSEELAKEFKRKPGNLAMTLRQYARKHEMPVDVVVRNNTLYFIRLDIDKEGQKIEDWKSKAFPTVDTQEVSEEDI